MFFMKIILTQSGRRTPNQSHAKDLQCSQITWQCISIYPTKWWASCASYLASPFSFLSTLPPVRPGYITNYHPRSICFLKQQKSESTVQVDRYESVYRKLTFLSGFCISGRTAQNGFTNSRNLTESVSSKQKALSE